MAFAFGAGIGSEIQDETRDGTFQLLLLRTRVSLSFPPSSPPPLSKENQEEK